MWDLDSGERVAALQYHPVSVEVRPHRYHSNNASQQALHARGHTHISITMLQVHQTTLPSTTLASTCVEQVHTLRRQLGCKYNVVM